jgi:hypothetical protein
MLKETAAAGIPRAADNAIDLEDGDEDALLLFELEEDDGINTTEIFALRDNLNINGGAVCSFSLSQVQENTFIVNSREYIYC